VRSWRSPGVTPAEILLVTVGVTREPLVTREEFASEELGEFGGTVDTSISID
jgi:hypothetical protein